MTDTQIIETVQTSIEKSISRYSSLVNQQLINVDLRLTQQSQSLKSIESKVSLQNGNVAAAMNRIAELETARLLKAMECPYKDDIAELKEKDVKSDQDALTKTSIKKYLRWVIVAIAAMITAGAAVTALFL